MPRLEGSFQPGGNDFTGYRPDLEDREEILKGFYLLKSGESLTYLAGGACATRHRKDLAGAIPWQQMGSFAISSMLAFQILIRMGNRTKKIFKMIFRLIGATTDARSMTTFAETMARRSQLA